jgi:predicted AlkP superfamily phosphohydrolase/phosphomutase
MPDQRKVFLLGLDGLPAGVFFRFLSEGRLPRFARLVKRAATLEAIPTLPPLTCPGWLSIASGAHPGSHGIANLLLPIPGAAPDIVGNGFDRERARAELLWEAMDRSGLDAIVLKYPGSWPPRQGRFVQVDGAGGYADITCRFEVAPSQAYVMRSCGSAPESAPPPAHFPLGYRDHWRTHTRNAHAVVDLLAREPRGWRNLPPEVEPAWEFVVPVHQRGLRQRQIYHGLAYRYQGQEGLVLSPEKDFATATARLCRSEPWSGWLYAEKDRQRYAFRFKLLDLVLEQRQLWLYRTSGHRLTGFTRPEELAEELAETVGPVVEWAGAYDLLNGLVDFETQLDIYRQHTEWLCSAIRHLAATRPWRGFFTQWHVIEYAHHLVGASLDEQHPHHDPAKAARDLDWLGEVYGLADLLLEAVEASLDEQTLLVVASDHGHDLVHTVFYINHFLRKRGWLTTVQQSGRQVVDWSRSVAYGLFPGLILFNVAGRWPGGIVSKSEIPDLTLAITDALRDFQDARTGRRPVKVVLDRQDQAAFGQNGPLAPDLFFCMDRGYEPATRIEYGPGGDRELEVTIPYREVTSGHGSFFPASASARTLALLAGPGFGPAGFGQRAPISVVDLAPTMAEFLDIAPPRHCEGRAVRIDPDAAEARESRG